MDIVKYALSWGKKSSQTCPVGWSSRSCWMLLISLGGRLYPTGGHEGSLTTSGWKI